MDRDQAILDLPLIGTIQGDDYFYLVRPNPDFPNVDADVRGFDRIVQGTTLQGFLTSFWHTGSGAPGASLGTDEDFYIDSATGDIYQKKAGAWGSPFTTIVGAQGPVGPEGPQGPEGPSGDGSGDMVASQYDPQGIAGDAFARANHTGTQTLATISDAGGAAALEVGTAAGTVAAGDHNHDADYAALGHDHDADYISIVGGATDGNLPQWASGELGDSGVGIATVVTRNVVLKIGRNDEALVSGNGAFYFVVPDQLDGYNLTGIHGHVYTASSSGAVSVQLHNVTNAVDMLSTNLTIDVSETDSLTAATPAAINTANDNVSHGDVLRVDVDGAGTGVTGLELRLRLAKP